MAVARAGGRYHAHPDVAHWTREAAGGIATALRLALIERPRARLLLSGGSTPAPVYVALSKLVLDWSRVDVALVDERWLLPDDSDSNARLVRDSLLQNLAAGVRFEPLTRQGRSFDECVSAANMHARQPPAVVVLGMGPDGHTASLFPRMRGLDDALASRMAYVAVDAGGCPGAGNWLRRISLTPAGLAPATTRLLLIRGEDKRALLDRVVAGDDVHEYPVRIVFSTPGATTDVHWCP